MLHVFRNRFAGLRIYKNLGGLTWNHSKERYDMNYEPAAT